MLTLWFLGNKTSFRETAFQFGLSISAAHRSLKKLQQSKQKHKIERERELDRKSKKSTKLSERQTVREGKTEKGDP